MWVRVLGSAAGGGSPQWNCGCPVCLAVRAGSIARRTVSALAVSADRVRWFLVNASPDVLGQLETLPLERSGRAAPVGAVLLTDAELDHTLGLLLLREASRLRVHSTAAVHRILTEGSGVLPLLSRYCAVDWVPVLPEMPFDLADGLRCEAFDAPTDKADRFGTGLSPGRVVGYRFSSGGRSLVYLPGVQAMTPGVRAAIAGCDCLLIDGTCWSDDELPRLGLSGRTSRAMGHLPISESLPLVDDLGIHRVVYVHLNNTNPVLLDDSPERVRLEKHGVDVAYDGLELEV